MRRPPKTAPSQPATPAGREPSINGDALPERLGRRFASTGLSPASLLDFLSAITDNLGEGTYALDTVGNVTFMNPAAERMLGWTEAELRGKEMHAAIHYLHPDGTPFPSETCPLLRVIQSGLPDRVDEDVFIRRDGSLFPVAYISSPLVTDGVVTGAVLAFHDISEHKALDEALRRSEREAAQRASQLLAVFESMADAVLVYDHEGHITQRNAADSDMLALAGYAGDPLVTLESRRALVGFRDAREEALDDTQWPDARVLRGEVLRGDSAVDMTLNAPGGHGMTLNISGAPVRDASGAITGGVLIGRDVTQRRRLERQTREALAALMEMAETLVSADVGPPAEGLRGTSNIARRLAELTHAVMGCERVNIVVNDPITGVMRAAGVAGLTREQEDAWRAVWPKAGRQVDYLPPELIARLDAGETLFIDRTLPPFNRWPNPFHSRTILVLPLRIGNTHLGDLSLDYGPTLYHPSTDALAMAGAVTRLAAQIVERERLARDREEARANALALAETTRRMDEFLSIAAHELKTPVTNSVLALTLAGDTMRKALARPTTVAPPDPSRAALVSALGPALTMLERAETNTARLSRLVVDLLDVSRIQAGKLELRLAPCDLAALTREAVEEQRQLTPGRAIRLRLPATPATVRADPDRIRQVVANFLTNALKYSREPRPVSVSVRTNGAWARVSVRDEGPGTPPAERRRVWERFYRAPGTQVVSGVGVGLGLGLYISRTIIEQHSGRIGLRSAQPHGSVFWFALRLLDSV